MDYAPYVYAIPGSGPKPTLGRVGFAAAFALRFLYEAYWDPVEGSLVPFARLIHDSGKKAYSLRSILVWT